jgi:endo-1,4-beta-D-glucanase Y
LGLALAVLLAAGCCTACWNTEPLDGDGGGASDGNQGASGPGSNGSGAGSSSQGSGMPSTGQGGAPAGCDGGDGEAAHPFGNHAFSYVAGTILPTVGALGALDQVVIDDYEQWKSRYVTAGCGGYFIEADLGSARTVSEAHGYGMVAMAYMAGHDPEAKVIFDGMHAYFVDHPSQGSSDLMAWSQDYSCNSNQGEGSATDGDLDIAYALLLADKQWGSGGAINYRSEADRVIKAILQHEVDDSRSWFLLGDWVNKNSYAHYDATRSSDFMPGHVASFIAAGSHPAWSTVIDGGYGNFATIQQSHAPATGLLPDFIRYPSSTPAAAESGFLEGEHDGSYHYNACRVPWRLAAHYLTTGDARAKAVLSKINSFLKSSTSGDPDNIAAGYWLDGDGLPGSNFTSTAFVGPFGVAAMIDGGNQAWLNSIWTLLDQRQLDGVYYEDTIKLLTMITMSGNWWAPEAAPCP